MLLKLSREGRHKDLDDNAWFFLIPEFQNLTSRQAEFVALVADFESKIPKGLPTMERRKLAALRAGWGTRHDRITTLDTRGAEIANGKIPQVETAIKKYLELQRELNEDYKMMEFLGERIEHLKKLISSPSKDLRDDKDKTTLTKELFDLFERKREFEKKIGKEPDPMVLGEESAEGGETNERNLSTIDKVNAKMI